MKAIIMNPSWDQTTELLLKRGSIKIPHADSNTFEAILKEKDIEFTKHEDTTNKLTKFTFVKLTDTESKYFEFINACASIGFDAHAETRHCNFTNDNEKVVKESLAYYREKLNQVNEKLAAVEESARKRFKWA